MAIANAAFTHDVDHRLYSSASQKNEMTSISSPIITSDPTAPADDKPYYHYPQQYRKQVPESVHDLQYRMAHQFLQHPEERPKSSEEIPTQEHVDNDVYFSFAGGFKRRPSLREAARSFRALRHSKRRRRQDRPSCDSDQVDDAEASTSESDSVAGVPDEHELADSQHGSEHHSRKSNVMSNLMNGLHTSLAIRTHGRARGSSSTSRSSSHLMDSSDSASTNTSFTTFSNTSKRSRYTEDQDSGRDDDEGSDRGNKRPCSTIAPESDQPQLFACPFAKYDPKRYSAANLDELNYRGCAQSYLTDLARVKQHLYRVHERPQHYCSTCYETFKTQAQCSRHTSEKRCLPNACPFNEKMTPAQLLLIKKKNRGTNPCPGWYEIYRTLFPGSRVPLSPYADFTTAAPETLDTFVAYIQSELSARLQNQLESRVPSLMQTPRVRGTITEAIQSSLPDILRDLRRDFGQLSQLKPPTTPQEPIRNSPMVMQEAEPPTVLNYHNLATLDSTSQQQSRSRRPSAISIPQNLFAFGVTLPIHVAQGGDLAHAGLNNQQTDQDGDVLYHSHRFTYDLAGGHLMPSLTSEPLTAIWQPEQQQSQQGYFTEHHQAQQLVPGYSLHLQNEDGGIPTMVTTSINHTMTDHTGQNVIQGWFHHDFDGGN